MTMNKVSKFVSTAVIAASSLMSPAQAASDFDAHVTLFQAVESAGVEIFISPPEVCDAEDAPMGFYSGSHDVMVVCQDNRIAGSDKEVTWTENDLDTLRHEAHHLAQDCVNGARDGDIAAVYKRPVAYGISVMGEEKANWVAGVYAENGADAHIQIMEIEAFAVAAENAPLDRFRTSLATASDMEIILASLVLIAVADLVAITSGDGRPTIGSDD